MDLYKRIRHRLYKTFKKKGRDTPKSLDSGYAISLEDEAETSKGSTGDQNNKPIRRLSDVVTLHISTQPISRPDSPEQLKIVTSDDKPKVISPESKTIKFSTSLDATDCIEQIPQSPFPSFSIFEKEKSSQAISEIVDRNESYEISLEQVDNETTRNGTTLEDTNLVEQMSQLFLSNETDKWHSAISAYLQNVGTFSAKAKSFLECLYLHDESLKHADNVFIGYESERPDEPVYLVLYSTVVPESKCLKLYNTFKIIHRGIGCISEEAKVISDMEMDRNLIFSEAEQKRLHKCLAKNTTILMNGHSNLLIISASKLKSEGYGTAHSKIREQTCIVFYVDVKGFIPFGEKLFPRHVDKYPVDVREGAFKTFSDPKDFHESLVMGCQIVTSYNTCGTLGAFVQLRDGGLGCLTCCHVFETPDSIIDYRKDPMSLSFFKREVYQPVPSNDYKFGNVALLINDSGDENNIGVDAALIVNNITRRYPQSGNFPTINCDIAGFSAETPLVFNSGEIIQSLDDIKLPCNIVKYGATTGLTIGLLRSFGSAVQVRKPSFHPGDNVRLHQQLEVFKIGEDFAQEGDSGAMVFCVRTTDETIELKALGLLVGGTTHGNGIVTPIWAILDKLRLPLQLFCFDRSYRKFDMSAIENQRFQTLRADVDDLKVGLSNVNSRLDVISSSMDSRLNDISLSMVKKEDIEKLIQLLRQTNQNS